MRHARARNQPHGRHRIAPPCEYVFHAGLRAENARPRLRGVRNFTFAGREDDGDVKLHAATVAESITNWPEVVAKLRGTRFEKYLTMDGSVLP